ncbi:hypothetical protein MA04_02398 [Alcanivorax balearicus MACL04]|uniref:Metallo-beta-lactamase domain-containing protein n=1 Tax=Alloalcanivorax balearicus MACL04 TaxID=1177182 RepID=A0ABT2R008_9GAMM|nr:MBL fold metallo-hydrolase [Alloalcanivorax balearicus]MCU5783098.1 hypothetical protein [Alloalcanivorax balearicus MACL04]
MKQIADDLWETEPEYPAPGLQTHAYLYAHPAGNVLFYNTSHDDELSAFADHGGVHRQYLSHRDEVGASLAVIRTRFNSQLCGHQRELEDIQKYCPVDVVLAQRELHPRDIEILPTPGHTPGSTCFWVRSPTGDRYLFTGDTLYFDEGGQGRNGFLPSMSDREALIESLHFLRTLSPDLVISSAFGAGGGYRRFEDALSWQGCVDEALAPLQDGAVD